MDIRIRILAGKDFVWVHLQTYSERTILKIVENILAKVFKLIFNGIKRNISEHIKYNLFI